MKLYRGEKPEVANDNAWYNEHFPDGKYRDIEGLCKIVTLDEVRENDYSLTPGRYVGITLVADDGMDYKARLAEIQGALSALNSEAAELAEVIDNNLRGLI